MNTNSASITQHFESLKKQAKVVNCSTATERIAKLKRLSKAIDDHQSEIEEALHADFGKPLTEARLNEIFVVQHDIKYAVKHLKNWMKPKPVKRSIVVPTASGEVRYHPKGTVLIISPWNFPFNLALSPLVSAIAAGNTVALKPSEISPFTTDEIERLLADVFAEDEVAVFKGGVDVAQTLIHLPFNHIFFTGSPQIGKVVMEAASKHLTSVTLELGGKSPAIVDASADLDKAAERIIWGKFINSGQTCIAPDYLLVDKSVKDLLIEKMIAQIKVKYGGETKENPDYCRIINDKHTSRIATWLEEAKSSGAKVVFGGNVDIASCHIEPTLITDLQETSTLMQQEIFGPILPIVPIDGLDDAIRVIESKERPLAMYLFSERKSHIRYIMERTIAGGVTINDVIVQFIHPELPFGGVNFSGFGNAHGEYGFKAFSHEQAVLKNASSLSPVKLFYPPYNSRTEKLANLFLKYLGR